MPAVANRDGSSILIIDVLFKGVSGDSMEPRFKSGDIVLVHSTPSVEIGQIGIFILNGQAFIKELGEGELISLNSKYDPIKVHEDDSIYCQGRVIKVLSAQR